MANSLASLFEKYLNKFEKEFLRAINTNDEEAIHDLRVSIKRIRALFLFIDEAGFSDIQSKKYLNKFKKIFKKSGRFREYQIHKNLYNQYRKKVKEAFPKLLSYLSESEQSSQKEFHEFMPGLEFRKLYKTSDDLINELKSIPPKKLDKQLFTFIKSRIDECYDYMFEIDYSVHLHQIRKYLKQIRFVVGEQIGNIYSYFDEEVNFNDTKKVEDILGDWHDRDEFSNLLLEFETIHQDKLTEEDKKKQEKYKRAVEKDINTDIQKLRPELLHLFSLMKATMEKQVKP